jgi:ligand-binding sensor domain-containing protein
MRHDIGKLAPTDVLLDKPPLRLLSLVVFAIATTVGGVSLFADATPAPIRALRTFTRGSGTIGLPASTVVALHTDREGTIWIATFDGVAHVERGIVERLAPGKDVPVAGPMFKIIDRRDGGIFVAGASGVYEFDGSTWALLPSPEELTSLAEDAAKNIIGLDRRGHVWVKSPGKSWRENAATDAMELRALTSLPDGRVLAAGVAGVMRIDNGEIIGPLGDRPPDPLTTLMVASDGRVWAGTETGTLTTRLGEGPWQTIEIAGWDGGRIRSLAEDQRHRIWTGADNGRVAIGTATTPFEMWTPDNGLKASGVTALTGDFTGGMWLGYNGAGLQQWLGETWTHRTFWRQQGDADATITFSVRPTADGGFIAGVFSRGVWRWDGKTMAAYGREQGITEDVRFAIEPEPGVIWVGARNGIFEGKAGRFVRTLKLSGGFVSGFFKAPNGEWWATTTADGVFVRRGTEWQKHTSLNAQLAKFTPNIRDLIWRKNGELWIASGRDLITFPNGPDAAGVPLALPQGLSSPNALVVHDDSVWVGAVGGLAIRTGDSWRVITGADGLPGTTVYSMAFAPDGSLWAGGSAGVGHLQGSAWTVFDSSNGLISEECNTFGLIVRPSGGVIVGTMSGLAVYEPSTLSPQPRQELRSYWRSPLPDSQGLVRLPANDRRLLLEWSAPWPRPVPVLYRTRIREISESWSEPQAASALRVENLSAGSYSVEVESKFDRVGADWTKPLTATVIVAPRIWETLWAKTALVGLVALVMAGLVRWRTARLAARARELEAAVTEALSSAKVLRGLLPICAHCKKVRDDGGYWTRIEDYISRHSEADFSHGFCPDCVEKHYGDIQMKDLD